MLGQAKTILGLDIGSHSIKGIVLEDTKSGLVLRTMGLVHLPPQAIMDGEVQEKEIVVSAIKNLIKSLKIKAKNVCTSISGYSVIIKKISLPRAPRAELAQNIEVEAEQFIPFDISEVNVDFMILGEDEGEDDQMEVILVAAKKDVIETYIDILVEAGLSPNIVDVDVFALENAFTHSYPDQQGTVGLIDIGANKMNINIIKEGMSLFTKDAAMGGARITQDIQDAFGDMDHDTAEGIKLGGVEAPEQSPVEEVVTRAVENWIAESQRALDFLESTYPGEKVAEVYLSGGSSRIHGLDKAFSKELGLPVYLLDPFRKIGIDQKQFDPAYVEYMAPQVAICVGLALRRGEEI
ncbi:MAG: pilus assembly protein PilM [Proteobacteria bacterium]|nr:pilus assembly protein PilM [Pseudomonadota bacterium]